MIETVTAEGSRQAFRHGRTNVEGGGVQMFTIVLSSGTFYNVG